MANGRRASSRDVLQSPSDHPTHSLSLLQGVHDVAFRLNWTSLRHPSLPLICADRQRRRLEKLDVPGNLDYSTTNIRDSSTFANRLRTLLPPSLVGTADNHYVGPTQIPEI